MKSLFNIGILLIGLFLMTNSAGLFAQEGDIVVEVTGLKNADGNLCIALMNNANGFPSNQEAAIIQKIIPIKSKKMTFTLPNVKYGIYALSVMHDENKNNKMDIHFLGFPKEGYGVSNNIRNNFGPPKFKECAFSLNTDIKNLKIDIHYFMKK